MCQQEQAQSPGQRGCAAAGVQIASAGDAALGEAVTERQWEDDETAVGVEKNKFCAGQKWARRVTSE
ncbi:hypothetical protein G7054_g14185 [Neopestalotiopsis clavispora]|nr:hypothetical protein G7054_g14185 [Neopestalotiopsis clavispora]